VAKITLVGGEVVGVSLACGNAVASGEGDGVRAGSVTTTVGTDVAGGTGDGVCVDVMKGCVVWVAVGSPTVL